MYKVMIVDDEPIAVESVAFMIKQNLVEAIVAGTCRSGKEAIEKAGTLYPDIVIMDIDMPGINGLNAIKKIKEGNPDVCIIVLTAFDYFDYAMESMSLGVMDFLVKPVSEVKFVNSLRMVMQKLDESREKKQHELQQQERLEMTLPVLEDAFHKALRLSGDVNELSHYCNLLARGDIGGYILIIETNLAKDESFEKKSAICQNILKRYMDCIVDPARHHRVTAYIFDNDSEENEHRGKVMQMAHEIARRASHEGIEIAIGIGNHYNSVVDARNSYREARIALRYAIDNKKYRILQYRDTTDHNVQPVSDRLHMQEQVLFSRIDEIDIDGVCEAFEQLAILLKKTENDSSSLNSRLVELAHSIGRKWNLPIEDCHAVVREMMSPDTSDEELFAMLMEYIESSMFLIAHTRIYKPAGVIQLAEKYMEEHYAEQISLESIADYVKLSSFYFSRFYKKVTSMNFSDKLSQIRIEHAKELLCREELSVKMVAYLVGYQEANYFSKIFKKLTGQTASEYKKMILDQEVCKK